MIALNIVPGFAQLYSSYRVHSSTFKVSKPKISRSFSFHILIVTINAVVKNKVYRTLLYPQ